LVGGLETYLRALIHRFVARGQNDPATLRTKLEWIRDHPAAARELGAAGRRRVLDRFTCQAVVQRCLDAYAGTAELAG